MKTVLIGAGVLIGIFVIFQIYLIIITNPSESYNLVKSKETFEIRYYPLITTAVISSSTKSYKDLGSIGFSKLANYISGANKENVHIAMNAPIYMDIGESTSTMSFIMPTKYTKEDIPTPNDTNIVIKVTAGEHVAAIRFAGFASDEKIRQKIKIFKNILQKQGYSYYGNFRFLSYNRPYQLFNRRNEIIVSVGSWN
ncbi:hypothetical protein AD998_20420 [bacterium 336/3]|nr:hypothetical protein AD998_20420 [bacterium 336/3]